MSGFDDNGDEARFREEVAECALDFLDEAEDEGEREGGCEATVAECVGEDDEGRAIGGEGVEVDGVGFVAGVVFGEDVVDGGEEVISLGALVRIGGERLDEAVEDGCVVFVAVERSEREGAVEIGVDEADGEWGCGEVSDEGDDAAPDVRAECLELLCDVRGGDASGGLVGVDAGEDDGCGAGLCAGDVEEGARVVGGGDWCGCGVLVHRV